MKKYKAKKSNLIIIGANATLTKNFINVLANSNKYERIFLISTSKLSLNNRGDKSFRWIRVRGSNLVSTIDQLLKKENRRSDIICTNIPTRNTFEIISKRNYIQEYEQLYELSSLRKYLQKIIFMGSTVALYPNFFKRKYNDYRKQELYSFMRFWNNGPFDASICLLPPLDTSNSFFGKLLFVEKRAIWAEKILANLQCIELRDNFIYPYRFLTFLIVMALISLNFTKYKK